METNITGEKKGNDCEVMTYWKLASALIFFFVVLIFMVIHDNVSNPCNDKGQGQKSWDETPRSSGSPASDPWEPFGMQRVGLHSAEEGKDPPSLLVANTTMPDSPAIRTKESNAPQGTWFMSLIGPLTSTCKGLSQEAFFLRHALSQFPHLFLCLQGNGLWITLVWLM